MRKDLVYALRTFRRNPMFTAAAVLTLALGIGANTALFTVINAALIRPLPYPDAGSLVKLYERLPDGVTNPFRSPIFWSSNMRLAASHVWPVTAQVR